MKLDAAAYLGAWPFRGNVNGTVTELRATLKELTCDRALVSPLPALFHADPIPANESLLQQLKGHANLWAAPVINPRMANSVSYIAQLARLRQVRALRLAPNFHGYALEQAREVVQAAADHGLAVVVQLRMQDERSHPVAFQLPPVALEEVVSIAEQVPTARVIAAAARIGEMGNPSLAPRLRGQRNLWLDVSHVDGLGCIRRARAAVGARKLLFATSWPFFYAHSALLKVKEAELPARDLDLLLGGNAEKVFAKA